MPPTIEQSINEEEVRKIKFITHPDEDGIMGACPNNCGACERDEKLKSFLRSSLLRISKQTRKETLAEVIKLAEGMKKDIRSTTGNVLTDSIHNSTLNTLITNLPK